jgi:hypothetical protein
MAVGSPNIPVVAREAPVQNVPLPRYKPMASVAVAVMIVWWSLGSQTQTRYQPGQLSRAHVHGGLFSR